MKILDLLRWQNSPESSNITAWSDESVRQHAADVIKLDRNSLLKSILDTLDAETVWFDAGVGPKSAKSIDKSHKDDLFLQLRWLGESNLPEIPDHCIAVIEREWNDNILVVNNLTMNWFPPDAIIEWTITYFHRWAPNWDSHEVKKEAA